MPSIPVPPMVLQLLYLVAAGFVFGIGFHTAGRLINRK